MMSSIGSEELQMTIFKIDLSIFDEITFFSNFHYVCTFGMIWSELFGKKFSVNLEIWSQRSDFLAVINFTQIK